MATKSVNKVTLLGHLGQDPELRFTGSGTPVCTLRIATNESYKDSTGNFVDKTEWHSVVAWARLAEICGEYLKKGSQVYIEGSLQTRSYDDRDGNTKYVTEIKAREMVMLGGRGNGGGGFSGQSGGMSQSQGSAQPTAATTTSGGFSGGDSIDPDDELPF